MASKTDLQITIIGAGRNQFGLRLLGIVARLFGIRLEVVRPTKRAADASPESPLKNKRQVAKRR